MWYGSVAGLECGNFTERCGSRESVVVILEVLFPQRFHKKPGLKCQCFPLVGAGFLLALFRWGFFGRLVAWKFLCIRHLSHEHPGHFVRWPPFPLKNFSNLQNLLSGFQIKLVPYKIDSTQTAASHTHRVITITYTIKTSNLKPFSQNLGLKIHSHVMSEKVCGLRLFHPRLPWNVCNHGKGHMYT